MRQISSTVFVDKRFGTLYATIGDRYVEVWPSQNATFVSSVFLATRNRNTFPRLSDLIAEYGLPCFVGPGLDADRIALHYPNLEIEVRLNDDRIMVVPDINFVKLAEANSISGSNVSDSCKPDDGTAKWKGFTTLERYFEAGLIYPLLEK